MSSSGRRLPGLLGVSDVEFAVVSNPGTPDRLAAIAGTGPSPLPHLAESARLVERLGAAHLAYPCNTAHYFLWRATPEQLPLHVPLVDMIHETVDAVVCAGHRVVGLLAATGTTTTGLYQDALAARGVTTLVPETARQLGFAPMTDERGHVRPEAYRAYGVEPGEALGDAAFETFATDLVRQLGEQDGLVMEAIVGGAGVKAGYRSGLVPQLLNEAARRLAARGAQALVLGCSEVPLVLTGTCATYGGRPVDLLDPTSVPAACLLARAGRHGIAGGLGPEATIDLQVKMGAPRDFTDLQYAVLRQTVRQLGARRDQDHLMLLGLAGPDPVEAARALARAGAAFLALTESASGAADAVAAATGLPIVAAGSDQQTGAEVVRRAAEHAIA